MVDGDHQVPVPALVADLVQSDPDEPVERVAGGSVLGHDPVHDRPDRGPRHPQQLHHRRLGRVHGEPRRHVIERPGVAGAVAGPGDLGHRRPMLGAVHPGGVSLEERADLAQVQRPPPPAPLTLVVAWRRAGATPAAALPRPPWTDVGDHGISVLVELDLLDHDLVAHAQQTTPYFDSEHPVLLRTFWTLDKPRNLGRERGSHADGALRHPRKGEGSRIYHLVR